MATLRTRRGYAIDATARTYLLAGDESAVPAISMLLRFGERDVAHSNAVIRGYWKVKP